MSICLNEFVNALVRKAKEFIYMPESASEIDDVKKGFYEVAGFPGVIGCIDGTHIPIIAPSEDEYMYINRKQFH